ncbi:MAG: hypothetical protein ACYDGY_08395 [Acidimicrobiales bacterium]
MSSKLDEELTAWIRSQRSEGLAYIRLGSVSLRARGCCPSLSEHQLDTPVCAGGQVAGTVLPATIVKVTTPYQSG